MLTMLTTRPILGLMGRYQTRIPNRRLSALTDTGISASDTTQCYNPLLWRSEMIILLSVASFGLIKKKGGKRKKNQRGWFKIKNTPRHFRTRAEVHILRLLMLAYLSYGLRCTANLTNVLYSNGWSWIHLFFSISLTGYSRLFFASLCL